MLNIYNQKWKQFFNVIMLCTTLTFLFTPLSSNVKAADVPRFSPEYVLSDQTYTSLRVFNNPDTIQQELEKSNSPLKSFKEDGKLASQIIWDAARGITSTKYNIKPNLNPAIILAYLEKEMGLLSNSNYNVKTDPEGRIKKAMGYGCPDVGDCDPEYLGFSNQINWGAFQLQLNFDTASPSSNKKIAPYFIGSIITTKDGYTFTIENAATASCYRYTPHVYYGCYNLWKIITGKGWGVSGTKYLYDDLDRTNLGSKNTGSPTVTVEKVSDDDGEKLLNTYFTLGQNEEKIQVLQRFLKQKGVFNNQNISAIYDRATAAAVKEYRFNTGKLLGNFRSLTPGQCRNLIRKTYNKSSESVDIKNLQICLTDIGFMDDFNQTGYYGDTTSKAHLYARKWILDEALPIGGTVPATTSNSVDPTLVVNPNPSPSVSNTTSCNVLGLNFIKGQVGQNVRDLQECLRVMGMFKWPAGVTGYFGDYTNELYNTWLENANCELIKKQAWAYGEKSERVKRLQVCLKEIGKFDYPSFTGFLGPITWRGVKSL
jgi:hypothetical protein